MEGAIASSRAYRDLPTGRLLILASRHLAFTTPGPV